jgi:lantibiotic modifying enzyme
VPHPAQTYRDLAERSWQWALTRVQYDDQALWLPERPHQTEPDEFSFGLHSGIAGLAHVMAEIRLTRSLSSLERSVADGIAETLTRRIDDETEFDYFNGLVSTIGALAAIGAAGADRAVARLRELATPDGWQTAWMEQYRYPADARCTDPTIGNAAVLLGALWALRDDVPGAAELAELSVDITMAEREELPTGLDWSFVPRRFLVEPRGQMPNWSHGLAGVAGTLAAAGIALDRSDLVEAARRGAEHLVTLADTSDGGMRVPHVVPLSDEIDTYTYTWCHGPAGTSYLFSALDRAGVPEVAGRPPYDWERACLHSLQVSGIPERVYPGFWDNDGRCCGTAGVADMVLNVWQRHGLDDDLAFAIKLGDALVERAIDDGEHSYWRFVEHRNDDPLLPPAAGWMQGAAGIAAYLFRLARVLEQGRAADVVPRMDTWWALPVTGG